MDKKNPTLINMVLVLMIIGVVCTCVVTWVYTATKDTINNQEIQKTAKAVGQVFKNDNMSIEYDNNPVDEKFEVSSNVMVKNDTLKLDFYPAKKDGKLVAMAVKSSSEKGFGGHMEVLVSFDFNGKIINTMVNKLNETPGLGDKTQKEKSSWSEQFNGKDPQNFKLGIKKRGEGDVDAITAATISSNAYTEAVRIAYNTYMSYIGQKVEVQANSGATSK